MTDQPYIQLKEISFDIKPDKEQNEDIALAHNFLRLTIYLRQEHEKGYSYLTIGYDKERNKAVIDKQISNSDLEKLAIQEYDPAYIEPESISRKRVDKKSTICSLGYTIAAYLASESGVKTFEDTYISKMDRMLSWKNIREIRKEDELINFLLDSHAKDMMNLRQENTITNKFNPKYFDLISDMTLLRDYRKLTYYDIEQRLKEILADASIESKRKERKDDTSPFATRRQSIPVEMKPKDEGIQTIGSRPEDYHTETNDRPDPTVDLDDPKALAAKPKDGSESKKKGINDKYPGEVRIDLSLLEDTWDFEPVKPESVNPIIIKSTLPKSERDDDESPVETTRDPVTGNIVIKKYGD